VIAEGHVFIGSDDGNVYALDLRTGAKVWAFAPPHAADEEPGAFGAPPLYLAGTIYIGCTDRNLYALDSHSGQLKWAYQTGDKILGSANYVVVQASSLPSDAAGTAAPQAAVRILVGSYDTSMHCVDAATGKEVWTYQTGNWINGAPAIAAGEVVFGGCDATLHVIDAAMAVHISVTTATPSSAWTWPRPR
jgi:outer membrane protein assembly factor BamB